MKIRLLFLLLLTSCSALRGIASYSTPAFLQAQLVSSDVKALASSRDTLPKAKYDHSMWSQTYADVGTLIDTYSIIGNDTNSINQCNLLLKELKLWEHLDSENAGEFAMAFSGNIALKDVNSILRSEAIKNGAPKQ
jgi:hypothetical protein